MLGRMLTYSGVTTTANEDIMTILKTLSSLNGDTEHRPFVLHSFQLICTTDTDFKINNEPTYSPLYEDLIDGQFKISSEGLVGLAVQSLILKDSGKSYFIKFIY